MKNHKTIGDYYAHLLEKHLNAAIQAKVDETSGFKKKLAGIETIDDAKNKGYAPSDLQIGQIKALVKQHTNQQYYHPTFHQLPPREAIAELVAALIREIGVMNEGWRKNKQFCFDQDALADLAKEAAELIDGEHEEVKRHFFK